MRRVLCVLACLTVSLSFGVRGETLEGLSCNIGPLDKTYGGSSWQVYSCSDGKTLVAVAAKGSAAAPFHFVFTPDATGYDLKGAGSGSRKATDAAYKDLSAFSASDVRALIAATKKH
jgi:hypothetical protein